MEQGHIFIISMECESFGTGVIKICKALSPRANDRVEFASVSSNINLAEATTRSWLRRFRVNDRRDLFRVGLEYAVDMCVKALAHTEAYCTNMARAGSGICIRKDNYQSEKIVTFSQEEKLKIICAFLKIHLSGKIATPTGAVRVGLGESRKGGPTVAAAKKLLEENGFIYTN